MYHGCQVCYYQMPNPLTGEPSVHRYRERMKQEHEVRQLGYSTITIWGHEFTAMLKADPALKTFVDSLDIVDRLNPR